MYLPTNANNLSKPLNTSTPEMFSSKYYAKLISIEYSSLKSFNSLMVTLGKYIKIEN